MLSTYDTHAVKKATNLSINADLLKKAKSHKINISQSFEKHLAVLVREQEEKHWQEENKKAIDAFNERVGIKGLFGDAHRRF